MNRGARRRILAVFPDHPYPLDMGSRVRNLRILEALSGAFDLTIVTLVHDAALLRDPGPVAQLGRWIGILAPHRRGTVPWIGSHLRARWAAARGIHRETFFQSPPLLSREVSSLVEREPPDLVHAAYWYTLRHLRRRPRPPVWVVDTHDVQFERHQRLYARRSAAEKRGELAELSRYDHIIAITERDRNLFEQHLPAAHPPVEVIGMGLDPQSWSREGIRPALPPAPRVVFYGNLQTAVNQDALLHLLRDLLPGLRRRVPGLQILALGANPPESLRREAESLGAVVTGFVDDVRPWLVSATVVALSLAAASGQRGRVVEALALGVPVVGYPGALEGLELAEGEGIVSAPDSAGFGDALAELLADPQKCASLGARGRAAVSARYGLERTYGLFVDRYRSWLGG